MTEIEMLEYFKNQIFENKILQDAIYEECDFNFEKENVLQENINRLLKDRKCDNKIYPFGRDSRNGIFILVDDEYVAYISGNRSAQLCGILSRNVREFFNLLLTCKSLLHYFTSQDLASQKNFEESYEDWNFLSSGTSLQDKEIEDFIEKNKFETDVGKLYQMLVSAVTMKPEFIIEDTIYNIKINDLFRSDHKYIEKLINSNSNSMKIKKKSNNDIIKLLSSFKYHPNLSDDDIVIFEEEICQCCGREVEAYIENIYSRSDVDCICLECVSNGQAAKKFDAEFIQDAEYVTDSKKRDELFHRTPGYISWQGEYWLACCDDYCQYLGRVGIEELDELGITHEVLKNYVSENKNKFSLEDIKECLERDGSMTGYLFKCSHCGKYRLWIDEA